MSPSARGSVRGIGIMTYHAPLSSPQRYLIASGTAPPPTSCELLPEQHPHHYQRVLYPSAFSLCAQDVVSLDRLLISVDYPFSPNTRGRAFLDSLADMLNAEGLASLAHENAESLLRL
jgi:hypothetical protein